MNKLTSDDSHLKVSPDDDISFARSGVSVSAHRDTERSEKLRQVRLFGPALLVATRYTDITLLPLHTFHWVGQLVGGREIAACLVQTLNS